MRSGEAPGGLPGPGGTGAAGGRDGFSGVSGLSGVGGLGGLGGHGGLGGPGGPGGLGGPGPDRSARLREDERQLELTAEYAARLAAAYRASAGAQPTGSVVEVVSGAAAVRARLGEIQGGAREEVRCLDRPPYLDLAGTAADDMRVLRRGVSYRTIYDRAAVDQPSALRDIGAFVKAGQQARVLPTLPTKFYLIDDRLAVLPLHREPAGPGAIVVVRRCGLLDGLSTLFDRLWQRALPFDLPTTAEQPRRARGPSPHDDQRLVALLLSGLTDEAIARQLGVGYRTAQRRVADLMNSLGARTRFQAGVQIALRGQSEGATARAAPGGHPADPPPAAPA